MNKNEKGIQESITKKISKAVGVLLDTKGPTTAQLVDETLVTGMTALLHHRASVARQDGWDGWYASKECTMDHLEKLLQHHVDQGSMVNVALLASMIHVRKVMV